MALFGVTLKNNLGSQVYMANLKKKLKEPNLFKNPFRGTVSKLSEKDGLTNWLIVVLPVYAKVYYFGYMFLVIFLLLGVTSPVLYSVAGVLTATHFFYSKHFYISLLRKNLKKAGYEDKITVIPAYDLEEAITNVL